MSSAEWQSWGDRPDEAPPASLTVYRRLAIESMRRYWEIATHLGDEEGTLQSRHAELARTAAMVSIAESLDQLANASGDRAAVRRMQSIAASMASLAKELEKIRYMLKRGPT